MIRIEPRHRRLQYVTFAISALAAIIALLLAAIPLWLAGADLQVAYFQLAQGVFGSVFTISEVLTRATPLIFTGLAITIAFRAKLWNIGAEGQLYLGALAAVIVGSGAIDAPSYLLLPLVVLAGGAAGAVGMLLPAYLKTRFKADEVVTTLLLNFVIIILVQMLLEGVLQDPLGLGWPQSSPLLDAATLPQLLPRMRLHSGLVLALILAVIAHIWLNYSIWGFKLRAVGENAAAAGHAGIPVTRIFLSAAVISGACAGLAGVSEVAGLKGYLTADISPGFGYAGIVVAMLAGLSPLGVVAAAIFTAAIFVGADSMSRAIGVSNYLADLVVALSLLCVLIGGLLVNFKISFRSPR